MDPSAPSFTTIWVVLPVSVALLVVGASWRVFELPFCPLPPGAGASTFAINTYDSVMPAFLLARVRLLLHAGAPLERSRVARDLELGG